MRKEGFALGNSSCLKIQRFKRDLSYHLLLFIVIDILQLGQFFAAYFVYLLIALLSKGGAHGTEMAWFSAVEAKFLFNAAFAFFWGELGDLDRIHDHGVGVVGLGVGGVGEGVVGLMRRPRVPLGDVVGALPLSLEGDSLLVPFVDGGGDGVHRHDSAHERWWDSGGEVSDQDIRVRDVGEGDMVFEGGNVFRQGGGVIVVFLALLHSLGG